jgi:hypothetical protein
MPRSLASVLAVSTLATLATACSDAPSAPRPVPAQPSASVSSSYNRTFNDVGVNVHLPIQIPCSRLGMEIVPLYGVEHTSLQFAQTATGATSVKLHVNAQGVTGVGLVTGDTYHASGTTDETYDLDAFGLTQTYYLTYTFNVTSAGATGNIRAHEILRMSFDASGYPVLEVAKFDAVCS